LVLPNVVKQQKHLLNPNGKIVEIPCALAKRKTFLTWPEQQLKEMVILSEALISALNIAIVSINGSVFGLAGLVLGIIFAKNPFGFPIPLFNTNLLNSSAANIDRIGWMELSNDSFSIPKTFIGYENNGAWYVSGDTTVISTGQTVPVMSAANLMDKYHGKELATRGNQYLTYANRKFPFCCEDFGQILNNNVFVTPDNSFGKITRMVWGLEDEQAAPVDYRINNKFTSNLKEQIIIDGNQ